MGIPFCGVSERISAVPGAADAVKAAVQAFRKGLSKKAAAHRSSNRATRAFKLLEKA
jgi:hypothetical protein